MTRPLLSHHAWVHHLHLHHLHLLRVYTSRYHPSIHRLVHRGSSQLLVPLVLVRRHGLEHRLRQHRCSHYRHLVRGDLRLGLGRGAAGERPRRRVGEHHPVQRRASARAYAQLRLEHRRYGVYDPRSGHRAAVRGHARECRRDPDPDPGHELRLRVRRKEELRLRLRNPRGAGLDRHHVAPHTLKDGLGRLGLQRGCKNGGCRSLGLNRLRGRSRRSKDL